MAQTIRLNMETEFREFEKLHGHFRRDKYGHPYGEITSRAEFGLCAVIEKEWWPTVTLRIWRDPEGVAAERAARREKRLAQERLDAQMLRIQRGKGPHLGPFDRYGGIL